MPLSVCHTTCLWCTLVGLLLGLLLDYFWVTPGLLLRRWGLVPLASSGGWPCHLLCCPATPNSPSGKLGKTSSNHAVQLDTKAATKLGLAQVGRQLVTNTRQWTKELTSLQTLIVGDQWVLAPAWWCLLCQVVCVIRPRSFAKVTDKRIGSPACAIWKCSHPSSIAYAWVRHTCARIW